MHFPVSRPVTRRQRCRNLQMAQTRRDLHMRIEKQTSSIARAEANRAAAWVWASESCTSASGHWWDWERANQRADGDGYRSVHLLQFSPTFSGSLDQIRLVIRGNCRGRAHRYLRVWSPSTWPVSCSGWATAPSPAPPDTQGTKSLPAIANTSR